MTRLRLGKTAFYGAMIMMVAAILAGCERPDPQETAVQLPTQTPLPPPTAVPLPTQPPVQVYVVIAQPTTRSEQPVADGQIVQVVTATPVVSGEATGIEDSAVSLSPTAQASAVATALPDNYFLGWAWAGSLLESNKLVTVDVGGIVLRDRPSQEGRTVGIVMGFADVIIVGADRCGYSPVIVHATNMLSRTTPRLEVLPPEPAPTELPPFFPTPVPLGKTTNGWVFTDELTILGQTAISGPLGVNLRSDPCWGATNLGFIPAGSDLIVLGLPSDQYTPVRVNNDVLQIPFDPMIIATVKAEIAVNRIPPPQESPHPTVAFGTPTAESSPTPAEASPEPTQVVASPSATETAALVTPSPTPTMTETPQP